jgi:serine/threonine protein kinase
MAAVTKLADLTDEQRRSLEGWLEGFARTWSEGGLDDAIVELRGLPDCPWRALALNQMVKFDLARQWQLGRNAALPNYLDRYPELGGPGAVAADVIWAEVKAKTKAGVPVDVEAYAATYPNQAAELRALAARAGSSSVPTTKKMRSEGLAAAAAARSGATAAADLAQPASRPSAAARAPSPASAPHTALSGQFGRYRIEKQLGQGGMGSVYMAYDTELHRHVALKIPQFTAEDGPEVIERFKHEARAAATLRHTNLCQVYDVGTIDGTFFLTMEFIAGKSLESYVAQQQGASPRFVALVISKLARALKTAHAKNVIHRDLKPSNIMMREADGTLEPVIVDFGLARRIEPGTARLTQAGMVIGTWQYMTPEQLCGEPDALGPGCDIYALGVIMYELLTGRLPYDAPGQVVRGNATALSSIRPELDPRLETICRKAMAASSAERYASMGDLATALAEFLRPSSERAPEVKAGAEPPSSAAQPPSKQQPAQATSQDFATPAKTRTPMIIAGAAAVGALAILGGSFAFWGRTSTTPAKLEPAVSDRQAGAKAPEAATTSAAEADPELLLENTRSAIRAGAMSDARKTLSQYLGTARAEKKEEARVLLADLDRATSKTEARNRAKGLGNRELKERLDQGVKDMLEVIHTPELRDDYAATLLEAIREEAEARSRSLALTNNTRPPALAKSVESVGGAAAKKARSPAPRGGGYFKLPVRQPEPGFKPLYNGQNFDGWEASVWRIATAKQGGSREVLCQPSSVVHKEGIEIVSEPLDGHLRTKALYLLGSFKFAYMISSLVPMTPPKKGARNTSGSPIRRPHVSTTLFLDQPLKIGNTAQCTAITLYLAPVNFGRMMTLGHGSRRDESFYEPASSETSRPRGQWNEVEIRYGEKDVRFIVNGVAVNRVDTPRKLNCKVGFSFDGQQVHFANVRLAEGSR